MPFGIGMIPCGRKARGDKGTGDLSSLKAYLELYVAPGYRQSPSAGKVSLYQGAVTTKLDATPKTYNGMLRWAGQVVAVV